MNKMIPQSKITVYAAIAGVFGLMGAIFFYSTLDYAALESAEINLIDVEIINLNETKDQAKISVTFLITNTSDKTITVGMIDYKILIDGDEFGEGQYSAMDVALPGRAVFSPNEQIPLKSTMIVEKSESNSENFEKLVNNGVIEISAEGILTTQTTWTVAETEFSTKLS